jgi:hypothetical protein
MLVSGAAVVALLAGAWVVTLVQLVSEIRVGGEFHVIVVGGYSFLLALFNVLEVPAVVVFSGAIRTLRDSQLAGNPDP